MIHGIQALKSPLQRLGARADIALAHGHSRMARNPHNCEGVHARLPQPSEHRLPMRVYHDIGRQTPQGTHACVGMVEVVCRKLAALSSQKTKGEKRSYQDSGPSRAKIPSALNSKELAAVISYITRSSILVRFAEK
jgi:hypothetical protein